MTHWATEQFCLGTFPLRMGNKFLSDTLYQSWALCLNWLPIDTKINQSCPSTLLNKLPRVSSALESLLNQNQVMCCQYVQNTDNCQFGGSLETAFLQMWCQALSIHEKHKINNYNWQTKLKTQTIQVVCAFNLRVILFLALFRGFFWDSL